ncbi:syntaxin-71-like [Panicum virgatum]|uniref:syntaxin-71-like n=1 Tax=Panicum virgatum TaxID=38727 RepID=UPI0019D53D7D|nr:syntaxin-71-like [Panicum virgatum]
MSMIDVLTRVDAICNKYERYDADRHWGDGDPFSRLYAAVDAEIDAAVEKSGRAAKEKNRAASVAMNADVRRTKARLLEEVVKLQKIATKKVKGLPPEEKALRADLVAALPHRIQAVPDTHGGGATDHDGGWNARPGIKFDDSSVEKLEEGYFPTSEQSEQFRTEYEMRRIKQDEGLDFISESLDTLKNLNLAEDMNEELDRQAPLMDEIDTKVDKANLEIKRTNVRLKQTVNQFRSTRNFLIDIILICIILGIATYLYE